jgi:drug/metabolite transporter (DMT)-like permease
MSPSETPTLHELRCAVGASRAKTAERATLRAMRSVIAAATLWGCWSIVFRSAEAASTTPLSAAVETTVVFIVILACAGPIALILRLRARSVEVAAVRSHRQWWALAVLGVVDAGNALCFFAAMQRTTVAIAVLCHCLAPLIVAAVSPFVLQEKPRATTSAALALSLCGLVLLLEPWGQASAADLDGAVLALASAGLYAGSVLLGKKLGGAFLVVELAAWPKLTSVPVLLLAVASSSTPASLEAEPGLILVVGGVVCGALPLWLYYRGLANLPASQVGVLTLVEPLVAVLVGVFVWGEPLGVSGVVGAGLMVAGALLIARRGPGDEAGR